MWSTIFSVVSFLIEKYTGMRRAQERRGGEGRGKMLTSIENISFRQPVFKSIQ